LFGLVLDGGDEAGRPSGRQQLLGVCAGCRNTALSRFGACKILKCDRESLIGGPFTPISRQIARYALRNAVSNYERRWSCEPQ
jgi:hypothetical protein